MSKPNTKGIHFHFFFLNDKIGGESIKENFFLVPRGKSVWEKEEKILKLEINNLRGSLRDVEQQLANEKSNADSERKKVTLLQEQLKEKDSNFVNKDSNSPSRSSPTLSFGRASLSESVTSNIWPQVILILF